MATYRLVLCNVPDLNCARHLAQALVSAQLAACVNIVPQVESWYCWEGKLEHTNELTLLIKTTSVAYPQIERTIQELHPYQVPEIIALPIEHGLASYLNWITQNTIHS